MAMSKKAKAAKAAYLREWHKKHPDKRRKYAEKYWKRRAAKSESAVLADTDNLTKISQEENNHEK